MTLRDVLVAYLSVHGGLAVLFLTWVATHQEELVVMMEGRKAERGDATPASRTGLWIAALAASSLLPLLLLMGAWSLFRRLWAGGPAR